MLSHCMSPTKMEGYDKDAQPYMLRDQHWNISLGNVCASVPSKKGQEVTLCRLDGEIKNMLVGKGEIADCQDALDKNFCRITVKIRLESLVREFIRSASGNHHVMIYGDHGEELKALNELFGITTIEA